MLFLTDDYYHYNIIEGMALRVAQARKVIVSKASTWGQPLRNIIMDYLDVSKDLFKDMRSSPVKSTLLLSLSGLGIVCYAKCPTLTDYHSEIIEYSNEIGLCAESTRNKRCKMHVDSMSTMLVDGYLEYMNFGLFSVILQRPNSSKCYNYHEVCTHLQPRLWTLPDRVVDVGVLGQWRILNKTMKDFDVNQDEL